MDNKAMNEVVSRHVFGEEPIPGYATPDYSGEMDAAWQVVEAMRDKGWSDFQLGNASERAWMATFITREGIRYWAYSDTPAGAICEAALKAAGHPAQEAT